MNAERRMKNEELRKRSDTFLRSAFFILHSAFAVAVCAQAAEKPYHLQLECNSAAPFPYLGKFGTVTLHVYSHGVRANSVWLNGFSRNGSPNVTVMNPLARMYAEVPISEFPAFIAQITDSESELVEGNAPIISAPTEGKVRGISARRYRLLYGPTAWIDIWTTQVIPENPQLKRMVDEFVRGVAPATADLMRKIPGNPLYVELNFSHYPKLPVVWLKSLTMDNRGEADALAVGAFYFKAPFIDAILK
jgi:hypothetical protein